MINSNEFVDTFSYKIIYIFTINDEFHKGRLKIGDTSISTNKTPDQLPPNCHELNVEAKKRIDSYTKTADIKYNLLHTELAIITYNKEGVLISEAFRDYDVHKILENSGIPKKSVGRANEWFEVDLETAKLAIKAKKENEDNLSGTTTMKGYTPIIFRPEQETAIEQTIERFKKQNRMLWNAKMRFGKTLTALEVIKRKKFKRSIIITHRPVVDKGWYEDFNKIFYDKDNYKYGSKQSGYSLSKLLNSGKNFVYFASIQDLRGSKKVGGIFDKNDEIFNLDWDFVIIDEAHEGTQTDLGQNVKDTIIKKRTKVLELSGTPFNILDQYDDLDIYTWDYVMEQEAKDNWDRLHCGDSNPYEELPKMHIFTYDLGEMLNNNQYDDIEDKAFNFKEFFRTWTGNIEQDFKVMPSDKEEGDFVHEDDVKSFLNLISRENENNNYPFASEEYRKLFKHSFWLLPGVAEAKAFSKLLRNHPVFSAFEIVNVAGEGDEEVHNIEALKDVKEAIDKAGEEGYTITLSCGRLTTGVTVKEWTSVMYLSGSYSISASNYLQTIFRAQSPCNKFGKMKTDCYVFDFAPDRTLKVIAEAVQLSTKAGKTYDKQKNALGKFLNYCPVISIDNTGMKPYNVSNMLQQLKRAYADKAVQNGFDDTSLYNDNLMSLTDMDLDEFEKLKEIIGSSKAQTTPKNIVINDQGFTDEEREKLEQIQKKPKKQRTLEEEVELKRLKELRKQKRTAISTLRAISIRMPLLIFGADIPITQDFKLRDFLNENIVDQKSWEEFMPQGVDRELFEKFIKYYDEEVFVAAGNKIRHIIKDSDNLSVEDRIRKITKLHSCFKNPDKETVLTPWRVVNMHLSDCLGGWCFYDDTFDVKEGILDKPRYISHDDVTSEVFNDKSQILEINSKTGLYQLYVAYSIYKNKVTSYNNELSLDEQQFIWLDVIKNNIFIISKTPMAKSIAKRTLLGFRESKFNAHYFDDMINQFENKDNLLIKKLSKPSYWNIKGVDKMKFNAIVGNPPYQEMDGGANASAKNIYPYFVNVSKKLHPNYVSLIIPARWYTSGKGLDDFRQDMIHDKHIIKLFDYVDSKDIFHTVEIKGGICYFLRSENEEKPCEIVYHSDEGIQHSTRYLHDLGEIYIRDERIISIAHKIIDNDFEAFDTIISSLKPYGLRGDFFKNPKKYDLPEILEDKVNSNDLAIYGLENNKRVYKYVPKNYPLPKKEGLDKYKLFVNRTYGNGKLGQDNRPTPEIGKPGQLCTETFLQVGPFESEIEAQNALKYMETKLFKLLVGINKTTQDAPKRVYTFVPMQDFTESSDIDWNGSVSEQLYEKYNLTQEEQDYIEKLILK
ncbi:Eco57I restriction-modification methylase domain-containing protein [Methanosphaera sp. BMS]|uniref:Eco57I restriction-modification methylase domain-containing protein n=1 Tax=Methanosphaera sp. BMS TaxID=1789762 RepID=UPI000DC1E7F8|nr:Eco57I restriction-modification methylase domain-containing protein [Methanosphaera sp. BMS]AWX31857.1 DEAD/DEAH box helicase [Methanosphaera sp. BMS]